jgi:hypothetical protein
MDDETMTIDDAIIETVRIDDNYIEIFGGATGLPEEAPYDWEVSRLQTGPGLANFLRQVSLKSWAHPQLVKHVIVTIADWFDGAIEREMQRQMKEEAQARGNS